MMRFTRWLGAATVASGLAVLATGCALQGDDDEDVGEAREAQLDGGTKDYLVYDIRNAMGALVGKVLVTRTAGAGYSADREYWYLTSNLSNDATFTFNGGTAEYWSTPPSGLGTLSFVTNRTPTWTLAAPPRDMLLWMSATGGDRIGIDWQMSNSGGNWSGSIKWFHSNTSNIFGAGTSTSLSPGETPTGTWYRYITYPL